VFKIISYKCTSLKVERHSFRTPVNINVFIKPYDLRFDFNEDKEFDKYKGELTCNSNDFVRFDN
jgi:hypothetical protein